jgi:alkylhydroperoxidase/carboxymuconolactone decarboxylase family protein YurZ
MKHFAAAMASLVLIASPAEAQETNTVQSSMATPSREDIRMVAPALDQYTQDRLLGDVWKRPGLGRRDRNIATLAALVARNQAIEMPFYLNLALDNGVKPQEIFRAHNPSRILLRLGERESGHCGDERRVRRAQDRAGSAARGVSGAAASQRGR